ncbi:hypothetical protein M758_UG086000 [Ceratodon purpureus]|nr:hypothetical protein M758_UG086000 [Ceratodon purpureus]
MAVPMCSRWSIHTSLCIRTGSCPVLGDRFCVPPSSVNLFGYFFCLLIFCWRALLAACIASFASALSSSSPYCGRGFGSPTRRFRPPPETAPAGLPLFATSFCRPSWLRSASSADGAVNSVC